MYSYQRQKHIFIVCCCVHNHICRYTLIDNILEDEDNVLEDANRDLKTSPTYFEEDNMSRLLNREDEGRGGKYKIHNYIKDVC